ncbi:MAG: hypothetical protein KF699_09895 [Phycisphaeraceae bacterium]|nr:hypothetical protein [Phycisphaeraceae bacterium]MBX3406494.1 hypothetical protein [Phycisphaeraceae bacterium]
MEAEAIVARLDEAARRGKLPGFSAARSGRGGGAGGTLFTITDFGSPFESIMVATVVRADSGTHLSFEVRLKPLMPAVFAAVLVVTVWPGVWLTDSLLRTYSSWYMSLPDWATYAWYLPLTVPFCPPAFMAAVRKSRAAAAAEARELIDKVGALLHARTEGV